MITQCGCQLIHVSELQWEERIRFGDKRNRAKTYWHDVENNLYLRLVDQPANAVEPRHVHPGTHATTVLKGRTRVDGLMLSTLDVILGPGNEPHGPLEYPDGCQLFSCFQGSNEHSAAREPSETKNYRLIQSEQIPWDARAGGKLHMKTLVDHGAGQLLLQAMRIAPGFTVPVGSRPHMQAALIVEGSAVIGNETLGVWDFMYMAAGVPHGPIHFPDGATLLMVAMRQM